MRKLTPVLIVDAIEPCLAFWTDRLGFAKIAEVPHGDRLGFVILQRDGVEIMYQTMASVADDVPAIAALGSGWRTGLYVEVESLADVERALEGVEPIVPKRTTFYGATEIGVRE